jgi:hypothetical protein
MIEQLPKVRSPMLLMRMLRMFPLGRQALQTVSELIIRAQTQLVSLQHVAQVLQAM